MKKSLPILLLAAMGCTALYAQDPVFSQFYANRVYLNPAFTGVEKGITYTALARSNYTAVQGGYNTIYASADVQEPFIRSGLGISVWRDVVEASNFTTSNAALNYSYRLPLTGDLALFQQDLLIGFRGGIAQRSVDWNKLTFLDQYDAVHGNVRPTSAVPITNRVAFFDADAGVVWRSSYRLRGNRDLRSTAGFSVAHLTQQDESLLGLPTRRPIRLTLHAGTELPVVWSELGNHEISWSPNFKIEYQPDLLLVTYGVFAYYEGGFMGFFYQNQNPLFDNRNTNALIFNAGWRWDLENNRSLLIGYSYDANVSGLSTATGGSHEVSVRCNFANFQLFKRRKAGERQALPCPKHF